MVIDATISKVYRRTDAGIFPNDWKAKKLGDVADITKLAGFEYTKYFNSYNDGGDVIVVRGTNITNNKLDLSDIRTIPRSTSNKLPRSKLRANDLVFAYVGTIGPVYLIEEDDKYHLGPNTCKISVKDVISPYFAFCYFDSWLVKKEIIEYTSVGAQPSLSMSKIRKFKITFPKQKAEQSAIATALSNIDKLITILEKLITKKRNIKQGAMQELLTGKRRLPGFSGKWESFAFGNIFVKMNAKAHQIQTSEYMNSGQLPIVDQGQEHVVGFTDRADKRFTCPEDGVIIFGDHTCIVKFIDFDFVVGADGTQILTTKAGHHTRFHAFQLQYHGIPTTGYNRHFKYLKERFYSAPSIDEQITITNVLSDMDTEINKLEQKLAKYKMIKQGMMQVLLTGKVRLVCPNQ